MAKRLQWLLTFLTVAGGAVFLYAQNPVSIAQIGTTAVTTTVPVSGTVTANLGTIGAASTAAKQPALGTAGTASADVITIQGIASMTKLLVTPDSVALPANQSVNVAQINGVTTTMGNGVSGTGVQRVTVASDSTGVVGLNAGTQYVGDVKLRAATANGTTPCYITSAASTNATNCKASAGLLYGVEVINTTSTLYYLRIYNLGSAPTCSSSTGFVGTYPVPHNTGAGGGLTSHYTIGDTYGTGIGFCLTGGGSSTDNTNAATGVYVWLHYN